MQKYVIGVDFGTLSARAVLVELSTGAQVCVSEFKYPHAIMSKKDFPSAKFPETFAMQHPGDYIQALKNVVSDIKAQTGIAKEQIQGVGIDFTTCTVLPIDENFQPLCLREEFKGEPHAFVKLWKHHGAEKEAELITKELEEYDAEMLSSYGGKVSSEWFFPKVLETFNKARHVYDKTYCFIEAGDYLTSLLTGNLQRNACVTGFKALWSKKKGFLKKDFWARIDNDFANTIEDKIIGQVLPEGQKAGVVNETGSELFGLSEGTFVAVAIGDAHASMPALSIAESGKLMLILGTSACHILIDEKDVSVDGICGKVQDGIIPNYVAYEAGQTCFGDAFEWFKNSALPKEYFERAESAGTDVFSYLNGLIKDDAVGQNGLLAIDWWNGNRTPYADFELSGVILGLTLLTKPEHIYRAIMEAHCFGTKRIIDIYRKSNILVNEVIVSGGIANKNPFLMQILSDVLGVKISVSKSKQSGAVGSAIYASVACGAFSNLQDAAKVIAEKDMIEYFPNMENNKKYELLYEQYLKLTKYFAETNQVLKIIKKI